MPRLVNRLPGFQSGAHRDGRKKLESLGRWSDAAMTEGEDEFREVVVKHLVPRRLGQTRPNKEMAISTSPRRLQTAAPWEPWQSHSVGRHLRASSRAAHQHGCREGTRSAGIRSRARKKLPLLRRPAFSRGNLEPPRNSPNTTSLNSQLLHSQLSTAPILLLEPSAGRCSSKMTATKIETRKTSRDAVSCSRNRSRLTGARTGGTSV